MLGTEYLNQLVDYHPYGIGGGGDTTIHVRMERKYTIVGRSDGTFLQAEIVCYQTAVPYLDTSIISVTKGMNTYNYKIIGVSEQKDFNGNTMFYTTLLIPVP